MRDSASGARVALALAVFLNAIALGLTALGIQMEPMSAKPIVSAVALGLLVAAIGAAILRNVTPHAITLARGVALVLIFVLMCIAILYFLAAGFESSGGGQVDAGLIALFAAAMMLQVTVLVTASRVDRQSLFGSPALAVGYGLVFWVVCAVILTVIDVVLDFA